jgi:hypothetical protein
MSCIPVPCLRWVVNDGNQVYYSQENLFKSVLFGIVGQPYVKTRQGPIVLWLRERKKAVTADSLAVVELR